LYDEAQLLNQPLQEQRIRTNIEMTFVSRSTMVDVCPKKELAAR
jgi:hypothetical protein